MPVEIKELVIRAVVEPEPSSATPQRRGSPKAPVERSVDVEACVRQVLRILKKSGER